MTNHFIVVFMMIPAAQTVFLLIIIIGKKFLKSGGVEILENTMYEISIVVPTVHPENWRPMYDSLVKCVKKHSYEVVFVGTCDLPENMVGIPDIKVIKDWGCPMRCIQIGVLHSSGKLMTLGADDGLFVEDWPEGFFPESLHEAEQLTLIRMAKRTGR